MSFLGKLFGNANERYVKKLWPLVYKINELKPVFQKYSDAELKGMTAKFKERLKNGESLDDLLVEAFATVREAADRTLGIDARLSDSALNDVQMLSAICIHRGQIVEMKTGEGKTRVAVPAVYLNSLLGGGVHIVTVNEYLAKRDALWMGQIYGFLGLSVACLGHMVSMQLVPEVNDGVDNVHGFSVKNENDRLKNISRKEAYLCDVIYGTNSEFGFDYLRDNMVDNLNQMVQRPLNFAVIDEVDSVLIDEARTPLIISAGAEESSSNYALFARLVRDLKENEDYNIDEKMRSSTLTADGIAKMEKALGVENIYVEGGTNTVHHLEQALHAQTLFKRDRDYVVKDGEIIIVDEFTGRLMQGRRYSEGLHQAIEAKEGLEVRQENQTLGTITIQNYFRMYKKLSGMTGTAATEAEEFSKIYKLDVTTIPTNKACIRKDLVDRIYASEEVKYKAIINEVKRRHELGQPVLIGTISIERNELLHELLTKAGIPHEILNAKHHEREAEIIAQAGKVGAVTVATNMAGRGVDIILGGNPVNEDEQKKVLSLGGLFVLGTERHESRRIDNQLRGRAGRQGDPGESQFYISLEDDLMRIFGPMTMMKSLMTRLNLSEDDPIENKVIASSIESAQKKVEGNNFDIRKNVLEYDDVINKQRNVIYGKRQEILQIFEKDKQSLREKILELVRSEISTVVNFHTAMERVDEWNIKEIGEVMNTIFKIPADLKEKLESFRDEEKLELKERQENIINYLTKIAEEEYIKLENRIKEDFTEDPAIFEQIEKKILLNSIDTLWIDQLEAMDHIKTGIRLQGYAQKDPLVEYKREGFRMFNQLLNLIQQQVVYRIYKVGVVKKKVEEASLLAKQGLKLMSAMAGQASKGATEKKDELNDKKVGRNDLCPCGSGKKYKKCHGK